MPDYTQHFNLILPDEEEFYSISVFNANAEAIDEKLSQSADALAAKADLGTDGKVLPEQLPPIAAPVTSVNGKTGTVTLTKADVGLSNVSNDAQIPLAQRGVANGVATLGAESEVPTAQLPEYFGFIGTAAGTAAKTLTIANLDIAALKPGTVVAFYLTNGNTNASPTLNVNGQGAKMMYSTLTGTNITAAEFSVATTYLAVWDGTNWGITNPQVNVPPDTFYGTSSTAAGTAAKTTSITGFMRRVGVIVGVYFSVTNTNASPTLNVTSTGAAQMRYNGAYITPGMIQANVLALFQWDGTYWQLLNPVPSSVSPFVKLADVTINASVQQVDIVLPKSINNYSELQIYLSNLLGDIGTTYFSVLFQGQTTDVYRSRTGTNSSRSTTLVARYAGTGNVTGLAAQISLVIDTLNLSGRNGTVASTMSLMSGIEPPSGSDSSLRNGYNTYDGGLPLNQINTINIATLAGKQFTNGKISIYGVLA